MRTSGTRYTDAIRFQAIKLYKEGATLAELTYRRRMPRNVKVIRLWLEAAGLKIRPKPPIFPRAEILKKLRNGHSRNELAEEYGCSLKFLSNLATGKISPSRRKKRKTKKTAKRKTAKKTMKRKTAKRKTAKRKTKKTVKRKTKKTVKRKTKKTAKRKTKKTAKRKTAKRKTVKRKTKTKKTAKRKTKKTAKRKTKKRKKAH